MNQVIIIGRNVRDIELRYLPNGGTSIAKFTLAVDKGMSKEKKTEAEAQGKPVVDFINCVSWKNTAEYIANYLVKGKLVAVNGRIVTGNYDDKDGKKIYTTEVNCQSVEILEYADKQEQAPEGFNNVSDNGNPIPF